MPRSSLKEFLRRERQYIGNHLTRHGKAHLGPGQEFAVRILVRQTKVVHVVAWQTGQLKTNDWIAYLAHPWNDGHRLILEKVREKGTVDLKGEWAKPFGMGVQVHEAMNRIARHAGLPYRLRSRKCVIWAVRV